MLCYRAKSLRGPGPIRRHAPLYALFCVWCLLMHLQLVELCAETPSKLTDSSGLERGNEGEAVCATSIPEHPIFMLPGVAGSGLMISAKDASLPRCNHSSPVSFPVPFRLWASLSLVWPPRSHQLCWMDMMQPTADEKGEVYASKEGVNIDVSQCHLGIPLCLNIGFRPLVCD